MRNLLILLLCAFVLSCKSTRTATTSSESQSDTVSQAQWHHSRNFSEDAHRRFTALSFDSCVVTFGGADASATPHDSYNSYPSGDRSASNKAKPSTSHGKPSPDAQRAPFPSVCGQPQTLTIYGLHLYHEEKEKSVAAQEQEDTFAQAKQSSFDKSKNSEKSKTSVLFMAKLSIALLVIIVAVAIIAYIRRRGSGRPTHFGHRLSQS